MAFQGEGTSESKAGAHTETLGGSKPSSKPKKERLNWRGEIGCWVKKRIGATQPGTLNLTTLVFLEKQLQR